MNRRVADGVEVNKKETLVNLKTLADQIILTHQEVYKSRTNKNSL